MGALDKLKDMKEQLEEENKNPVVEQEEELVDDQPEVKEEPKQDDKPVEEKPKEEPKVETAPQKSPSDFARERKEKRDREALLAQQVREANQMAAAYRKQLEDAQRPRQDADPEPNKAEDRDAWYDWRDRQVDKKLTQTQQLAQEAARRVQQQEEQTAREQNVQAARSEALGYENQFRAREPNYDAVKTNYVNMLVASEKLRNPRITQDQLVKTVDNILLMKLSGFVNEGYENPVEAMFEEARQYYTPPAAKEDEDTEERADMASVSKNRSRNAGTAGASGKGNGEITLQAFKGMTSGDYAKLPRAQKQKLLYGK